MSPISAWRLAGEYLENCNCEVLCPWNDTGRNGHYAPFTWTGP